MIRLVAIAALIAASSAAQQPAFQSPEQHVKAARALVQMERQSEAIQHLRKALRLSPMDPEANVELARLVPSEALRLLQVAVAAEPANRTSLNQLMLHCRAQSDAACAGFASRQYEVVGRANSPYQVTMSRASLIVEGPHEEHRWGRYQFPTMFRMGDGRLIVFVHVEADSATAYGSPKKTFVSSDDGFTWREDASAANERFGLRLADDEWLRIDTPPSLEAASLQLPEVVGKFNSYRVNYSLYRMRDLSRELRLIFFQRFSSGKWTQQATELNDPDGLRYTVQDRFPRIWWGEMKVAADRSLVAVTYPSISSDPPFKFASACWRSVDRGRTWQLQSRIPYQPDASADPKAEVRDGFTEPAFEIQADGSIYAVLRTTDGNGIGPMYHTRSRDLGRTWTRPRVFTQNGVLPRLLRLENGILVLASGRPGVQLRFSVKGNGEDWSEPWDLLPYDATKPQADTCGYTDLVALDGDSFLIVYSWFQKPDSEGRARKAILARRVHVIKKQ